MTSTTLTRKNIDNINISGVSFNFWKYVRTLRIPKTTRSFLSVEYKLEGSDKDTLEFIKKYKKTFESLADK